MALIIPFPPPGDRQARSPFALRQAVTADEARLLKSFRRASPLNQRYVMDWLAPSERETRPAPAPTRQAAPYTERERRQHDLDLWTGSIDRWTKERDERLRRMDCCADALQRDGRVVTPETRLCDLGEYINLNTITRYQAAGVSTVGEMAARGVPQWVKQHSQVATLAKFAGLEWRQLETGLAWAEQMLTQDQEHLAKVQQWGARP